MNASLMTPDQFGWAAVEMTRADDPHYIARQLKTFYDLPRNQRIALDELADLEVKRRAEAS